MCICECVLVRVCCVSVVCVCVYVMRVCVYIKDQVNVSGMFFRNRLSAIVPYYLCEQVMIWLYVGLL